MRDDQELLSSLHVDKPGRHELLMISSVLVPKQVHAGIDPWHNIAALLVLDADATSQDAIRELAQRFQYGAVSVLSFEQPGDAAVVLANSNIASLDLVVFYCGSDLTVLDELGPRIAAMQLLVNDLPPAPNVASLQSGAYELFDGIVSGLNDPLGSALMTFRMVASLRAPSTLNCMDVEDFLSVFESQQPVRVFAIDIAAKPAVTTPTGWSNAHVLTNGTDAVVVFDDKVGRLGTIRVVLDAVRSSSVIDQYESHNVRYLGTTKYFRDCE